MASPSFPYPCPPTGVGLPSQTSSATPNNATSGLISPPGSRRTSGDEPAAVPAAPSRHTLPSISEALGSEPLLRYLPSAVSKSSEAALPSPHPSAGTDTSRYVPALVPQSLERPLPVAPIPSSSSSLDHSPRSAVFGSAHQPRLPALQPATGVSSPVGPHQTGSSFGSHPPYEAQATSYHFSQPGPQAQFRPSPAAASAAPLYPSPTQSLPPQYARSWKGNGTETAEIRTVGGKPTGPAYGEVVKRQLDIFDLEGSLNEIAECSGKLLDFSRLYGDKAHRAHRSGPVVESMPSLGDLEDLLVKSAKIRDAIVRIRDVVVAQTASHNDQRQLAPSGHPLDNTAQHDSMKQGGFAGSDPKKRRGRAAPPGRCHSCNRAETPEWRRGPDGARTLCNACGLHYAKLTRKMGGNKAAIASSNLRPKNLGSPNAA